MTDLLQRNLYEGDFYAWTQAQAAALRRLAEQRVSLPLDLENLAEEVESLGRSDRRAVLSRRIMEQLLVLAHSPATGPRAHCASELDQLWIRLRDTITPALRAQLEQELERLFRDARELTGRKMQRFGEADAAAALPETCPYSLEQVLGDWMPEIGEPRR